MLGAPAQRFGHIRGEGMVAISQVICGIGLRGDERWAHLRKEMSLQQRAPLGHARRRPNARRPDARAVSRSLPRIARLTRVIDLGQVIEQVLRVHLGERLFHGCRQ